MFGSGVRLARAWEIVPKITWFNNLEIISDIIFRYFLADNWNKFIKNAHKKNITTFFFLYRIKLFVGMFIVSVNDCSNVSSFVAMFNIKIMAVQIILAVAA